MNRQKLNELLYQALETELGGVRVYEAAIRCAVNEDLKEEWEKYRDQTQKHVEVLTEVFDRMGLDVATVTPGRGVVSAKGQTLVEAMESALSAGDPQAAQIVAAECVVDAETKDHQNWELIGEAAKSFEGDDAQALLDAFEKVEDEEDEHLYHTAGWARELWLEALGLPAVLPPPEEVEDAETAIEAAQAKQRRGRMLKKRGGTSRRKSSRPKSATRR